MKDNNSGNVGTNNPNSGAHSVAAQGVGGPGSSSSGEDYIFQNGDDYRFEDDTDYFFN